MDGLFFIIGVFFVIFTVCAWWREFSVIIDNWLTPPPHKNQVINTLRLIKYAAWNLARTAKNSVGLIGDILITSWAASLGGGNSTMGFVLGLVLSDVVSCFICHKLYKVGFWQAAIGILTGKFNGKTTKEHAHARGIGTV